MPRHFSAPQHLCSLLLGPSMVTETKFALSKSWRSSAAMIGAMDLTITDSQFVLVMANLGSKIF